MTLPKEDKALISDMNERLKRLEDIIADRMSPCIAEEIIQPIETEQRWNVNTRKNNSKFEVIVYSIESEEKANKIREAIKQYLITNKF